jgi:hypothetical protein
MSWLPPPPRNPDGSEEKFWRPSALGRANPVELRYLVVEEILGASIGLTLSPWPHVDAAGRLRFPIGKTQSLAIDRQSFERYLGKHRRPRNLRRRPLRIGDVFAVKVSEAALAAVGAELEQPTQFRPLLPAGEWLRGNVYDLTAEAREVAKASFYAAVSDPLTPSQAAGLRDLLDAGPGGPRFPLPGRLRSTVATPAGAVVAMSVLALAGLGGGTALGRETGDDTATVTKAGATAIITRTDVHTTTIRRRIVRTVTQATTVSTTETTTTTTPTTETTPRQVTLTLTLTGNTAATVIVDPLDKDCVKPASSPKETCSYQLAAGTPVRLTPKSGAEFRGWRIDSCQKDVCVIDLNQALALTADFSVFR